MVTCSYFLEVFQKIEISKNSVSERWCSDSSIFSILKASLCGDLRKSCQSCTWGQNAQPQGSLAPIYLQWETSSPRATIAHLRVNKYSHWTKWGCFTICGYDGHLGHVIQISQTFVPLPYPWMLHIQFLFDWPSGFLKSVYERQTGQGQEMTLT